MAPLIEQFEQETGTDVEVRYGDSAELAATIAEEGDGSPADVFFARIRAPRRRGRRGACWLSCRPRSLDRVPGALPRPRRAAGSARRAARASSPTTPTSSQRARCPTRSSTSPIRGGRARVGVAPTNASFQAFVTAMRLQQGEEKTRAWLEALKENGVRFYERNTPIVEAVASGEIDLGLVNHYYLYLVQGGAARRAGREPLPPRRRPRRARQRRRCRRARERRTAAKRRSASSSSCSPTRASASIRSAAEEAEYPLVAGIPVKEGLPPLDVARAARRSTTRRSAKSSSARSSC